MLTAWTNPRTWVVGETPTAAIMNSAIRDNLNFLYSAPSCRAYTDPSQSIPDTTETGLALNGERWDTDTMHDTVTNNSRFTINTAGRYLLIACIQWAANATGSRQVNIAHSVGPVYVAQEVRPVVSAATVTVMTISTSFAAAVTDYFYVSLIQTSGGNLNAVRAGTYSPEFMTHWMGN